MGRSDGQVAVLTAAGAGLGAAWSAADVAVESDVDGYPRTAVAEFGGTGGWDTAAVDEVRYGAR